MIAASFLALSLAEAMAMGPETLDEAQRRSFDAQQTVWRTEGYGSLKNSDDPAKVVGGLKGLIEVRMKKSYGEAFPTLLHDLGKFESLRIASTTIPREEDLDAVCSLTFLDSLEIEGEKVTDDLPAKLRPLENLTHLELTGGDLTGRTLGELKALPKLYSLLVRNIEHWDPAAASQVVQIPKLHTFSAWNVALTDADVRILLEAPRLKWLHLTNTEITHESLQAIGQSPRLTRVEINGDSIRPESIQALAASRTIEYLDVRFLPLLDDAAVEAVGRMPQLKRVQIGSNNKVSDAAVRELSRRRPKLGILHPVMYQ